MIGPYETPERQWEQALTWPHHDCLWRPVAEPRDDQFHADKTVRFSFDRP